MTRAALKSDCANCAALCCVAFAFDKSDAFAIDKAAGVPCQHLAADHTCTIHAGLSDKGFGGCVQYDCSGAGQRVTQEVFDGRSWQDDPKLLAPMMEAFRAMRKIHDLLVLVDAAAALPLSETEMATLNDLNHRLDSGEKWTQARLSGFFDSGLSGEVADFLQSLRHHVDR